MASRKSIRMNRNKLSSIYNIYRLQFFDRTYCQRYYAVSLWIKTPIETIINKL